MVPFSFDSPGIEAPHLPPPPDHADVAPPHGGIVHSHLIESLAKELGRSAFEIKPIYEEMLAHMAEHARVRDYLPILVPKRVRHFFASEAKRRGLFFY